MKELTLFVFYSQTHISVTQFRSYPELRRKRTKIEQVELVVSSKDSTP